MSNAMHVAKTGLNAQNRRMQVISNNLANVNTTGFKRDRANFESLLYQIKRASGEQTSVDTNLTSAFAVGTGVRVNNTQKVYTQGSLINTDNALDMAIDGAGFFQVLLPDGRIGFTRNGAFTMRILLLDVGRGQGRETLQFVWPNGFGRFTLGYLVSSTST